MKTIYLAGGMRGVDWQSEVAKVLPGRVLFDPRECTSKDPAVFTEWDLQHVALADGVLAYMDSDNPSGYGLMLEVGFALARGTPVVFVDAMRDDDKRRKYFDMLRVKAAFVCSTLAEAAGYLQG